MTRKIDVHELGKIDEIIDELHDVRHEAVSMARYYENQDCHVVRSNHKTIKTIDRILAMLETD